MKVKKRKSKSVRPKDELVQAGDPGVNTQCAQLLAAKVSTRVTEHVSTALQEKSDVMEILEIFKVA